MECENCRKMRGLSEYNCPGKHIKISLCEECADLPFSKINSYKICRPIESAKEGARMFKMEEDYIQYITTPVQVENNTEDYIL